MAGETHGPSPGGTPRDRKVPLNAAPRQAAVIRQPWAAANWRGKAAP